MLKGANNKLKKCLFVFNRYTFYGGNGSCILDQQNTVPVNSKSKE